MNDGMLPDNGCDFIKPIPIWTAGRSRLEILQDVESLSQTKNRVKRKSMKKTGGFFYPFPFFS